MADGVTGNAISSEEVLPTVELERTAVCDAHVFRTFVRWLDVLEIIQKIANHARLERRVVHGGAAYPLPRGLIADQEASHMPVGIYGRIVPQAEPFAEEVDLLFLAGQEGPARTNVEFLHVGL